MKRTLIALLFLVISFVSLDVEACNTGQECKYNSAQWLHFMVVDSDGITPETGVSYTAVTIDYVKEDGTESTVSLAADCAAPCSSPTDGDWTEVGNGVYRAYEGTTATFDGKGNFTYVYSATGHKTQPYGMVIKTELGDEESDTLAAVETDTTEIGAAGAGLTAIPGIVSYTVTIASGNSDTWDTIEIDETTTITVTNQFTDWWLTCAKESRRIQATAQGTPDTISVYSGNPFDTAPVAASTCEITK